MPVSLALGVGLNEPMVRHWTGPLGVQAGVQRTSLSAPGGGLNEPMVRHWNGPLGVHT